MRRNESSRRRRSAGGGEAQPPGSPAWMMTYGDLITQVLAFFILLYSFSSINETKFRETLISLQGSFGAFSSGGPSVMGGARPSNPATGDPAQENSLNGIHQRIASAVSERQMDHIVRLEPMDGALLIRFDATALFDSGRAEIKQSAIPAVDAVAQVLAGVPNQIRIEGHTDSDPMIPNPQYPDNWMLSGARSASLLRFLHEFHQIPHPRLSIAGYADTRPVAGNDTPEGKAKNRRVDILVLGQ